MFSKTIFQFFIFVPYVIWCTLHLHKQVPWCMFMFVGVTNYTLAGEGLLKIYRSRLRFDPMCYTLERMLEVEF